MAQYMMATKAIHKLGDISRDEPDLCVIHSEDEKNYIGNWVTGFGFIDVKFPKSTTRELTDEEKEKYHGTQISIGGMPAFTIYTKEAKRVETTESPVITLPEDETRKKQLRDKLEEYKGRLHPYRPPEGQMGTICKIAVLERLLKDGQVNTWELSREMANTYGSGFDANDFNTACGVIDDYCETGGKNLHGGTGLRSTEQMNPKRLRPGYPPMGRKVRLLIDYKMSDELDLQPGDELRERDGKMEIVRKGERRPKPVIPAGSVGIVEEGPYCSGIFDYTKECPVQFGIDDSMVPQTLGVPWTLLELAD